MLTLLTAETKDLDLIMTLIQQAKAHLKKLGVDQWQRDYPDRACIENDIYEKNGYLLLQGDVAVGYLCIDFGGEPCYRDLKGSWNTTEPYAVVHRLTIGDEHKGKGYATEAFAATEKRCLQNGTHCIRVDTDNDNLSMKHIFEKSGFAYCGTVIYESEKIAFDKVF